MNAIIKKANSLVKSFFSEIESKGISFFRWLLIITAVIIVRNFLEGILEPPNVIGFLIKKSSIIDVFFNHHFIWYFPSFILIGLILMLFTGRKLSRIMNTVLFFSVIIWFVPVIDYIIYKGDHSGIGYMNTIKEVVAIFINCFNPFLVFERGTAGLRIECFLLCTGSLIYVTAFTGKLLKGILSFLAIYCFFIFYGFGFSAIFAHLSMLNPIIVKSAELPLFPYKEVFWNNSGMIYNNNNMYALLFLSVLIFLLYIYFSLVDKEKLKKTLRQLSIVSALFPIILTICGIIASYSVKNASFDLFLSHPFDMLASLGLVITAFILKNYKNLVKNSANLDSEEKNITLFLFAVIAVLFSLNASYAALVIVLFYFSSQYLEKSEIKGIYSVYPVQNLFYMIRESSFFLLGYTFWFKENAWNMLSKDFVSFLLVATFILFNFNGSSEEKISIKKRFTEVQSRILIIIILACNYAMLFNVLKTGTISVITSLLFAFFLQAVLIIRYGLGNLPKIVHKVFIILAVISVFVLRFK